MYIYVSQNTWTVDSKLYNNHNETQSWHQIIIYQWLAKKKIALRRRPTKVQQVAPGPEFGHGRLPASDQFCSFQTTTPQTVGDQF